jgi:Na+-transporting methylmalonyl-CoA/oxaloacetate decarboxylase gamma subunit
MGLQLTISKLKKRNKFLVALCLPVIVFVFLLGWVMYWVGDNARSQTKTAKPSKDNITIGAIVTEDEKEILAQ